MVFLTIASLYSIWSDWLASHADVTIWWNAANSLLCYTTPKLKHRKNVSITAHYEVTMLQQGAGNETKFARWSLT